MTERQVRIPKRAIDQAKEKNPFGLQQITGLDIASYEYLVNDSWVSPPFSGRPDGTRLCFPNLETFRASRQAYFIWQQIDQRSISRPAQPKKIFSRVFNSLLVCKPLPIFIPWGVRPEGEFGDKEILAMSQVASFLNTLGKKGLKTRVIIMPADLYATQVNSFDPVKTKQYFDQVKQASEKRGWKVMPWSKIRAQNQETYNRLAEEYTPEKITAILGQRIVDLAIGAAQKNSGFTTPGEIEAAAFRYLKERMIEAQIVDEGGAVKLSMVPKGKDNAVDMSLPRVYPIPNSLQFPWLN